MREQLRRRKATKMEENEGTWIAVVVRGKR
jgi:hypothetical protein